MTERYLAQRPRRAESARGALALLQPGHQTWTERLWEQAPQNHHPHCELSFADGSGGGGGGE